MEKQIWITLDNSAVVGDVNRCIQSGGKMHKEDNNGIWEAIKGLIEKRAKNEAIKVTWTKGHATDEDIAKGKASHEERSRNGEADKLATKGIASNKVDGVMVKAAKQRKTIAALQQTKLVKIWLNRQELTALDLAEQQQLDEEAQAIAEMQEAFKEKESKEPKPEEDIETPNIKEGERKPWQYVKVKIPTYQWDNGKGEHTAMLKADVLPDNLKEEQQSWWYKDANGKQSRVRLDFPLHLWGEVGNWWVKLKWGDRQPGQLKGVTWLELVADFEISSGINCKRPQSEDTWGARAELLRGIVKMILTVRGKGAGEMESLYGTSRRITALAPFGATFLSGLLRRPVFAAGEAIVKAVAVNAWQWAEDNKAPRIQLHKVSYSKFKRGEFKGKEAKEKLKREVEKAVQWDTA
jgi:hypothetical protein